MAEKTALNIMAPLSGLLVPLASVPDPVFAQKMVGDGVAIDPLDNVLRAPIDGEIVQLHPSHHAVAVRSNAGFVILMHIGLETVQLKGKGFYPKVKVGDKVTSGQPLIEFDIEYVASNAKSLLTPVLLTEGDGFELKLEAGPKVSAAHNKLFFVFNNAAGKSTNVSASTDLQAANGATVRKDNITIEMVSGLHARPAAVFAEKAKSFVSDIEILNGAKKANGKSVVALLAMELTAGSQISIAARGADAAQAIEGLVTTLKTLTEKEASHSAEAPAAKTSSKQLNVFSLSAGELSGVVASPGRAVGELFQLRAGDFKINKRGSGFEQEREMLKSAQKGAALQLEQLIAEFQGKGDTSHAEIFRAHLELLDDPELLNAALTEIGLGSSAAWAWKQSVDKSADQLARLKNELLAQRAADLRDVGARVLSELVGEPQTVEPPRGSIVIAENLTPSQMASFGGLSVQGFATVSGGATSHVAVLARSIGIPALVGLDPQVLSLPNGSQVILDANHGVLKTQVNAQEISAIQNENLQRAQMREAAIKLAHSPAITQDGVRVPVSANIGGLKDAQEAVRLGTDGVGLLRSEFLFLDRPTAPTEDEQYEIYQAIADALGDRPLTIRTLDIGGDKPLSYLPIPHEENPFLGVRGVRLTLREPKLMRDQIRAILRVKSKTKLKVMFPMVTTVSEVLEVLKIVDQECKQLKVERPFLGIMVEVPTVALHIEDFAPHVDFFSIGTNDLTQYTLAVDRGHPDLSRTIDTMDAGLLKLIQMTTEGAKKFNRHVSVCGGLASENKAVEILLKMGVDELSVSIASIPMIKEHVRTLKVN